MALDQQTLDQLLDTLSRFVHERLIPAEAAVDAEDRIPDDIVTGMKDLGLFGLTIPERYAGMGLTTAEGSRWRGPSPTRRQPSVPSSAPM